MNRLCVKLLLLTLGFAPMLVKADVIFSNVAGTGDVTGSAIVCGSTANACPFPGGGLDESEEFTPAADYTLTDAEVLVIVNHIGGDAQTFNVLLYSNNGGAPGSEIEQIGSELTATTTYPGSLITADATSSQQITLQSGTSYWLVLAPATADSFIGWENGGNAAVPFADSGNGGENWNSSGTGTFQFQIDGNPVSSVPEPSGVAFLAAGAILLVAPLKRLRRKA